MTLSEFLYLLSGFFGGFFLGSYFKDYFFKQGQPEEPHQPSQNTGQKQGEEGKGADAEEAEEKPQPEENKEITVQKIFKASIWGDPWTPDEVIFDKKGVTFNIREWISNTETFILYSDISGVEIIEGIWLATIKIKPKVKSEITINNFTKFDAAIIKKIILEKL
jgi:hypothetical protein